MLDEEFKYIREDFEEIINSMGLLENQTFMKLPKLLKEKYGIEMKERLLRTDIGGKEINVYGKGKKNGKDVLIVGEAKLRFDEKRLRKQKV